MKRKENDKELDALGKKAWFPYNESTSRSIAINKLYLDVAIDRSQTLVL